MEPYHCFRLNPYQDLKKEIHNYCTANGILAGAIVSAVGSLVQAKVRLAGSGDFFEANEKFEIVSATGTVSQNGSHLHIAIADTAGRVVGGHLVDGNLVYTTCEIIIINLSEFEFRREPDPVTGYNELQIRKII